ncbi:MAG: FtsX-like permease family protein [FCB group bacterium]|nr:FtsX-like permease family protein [FCB group bacterium]
MMIPVSYTIRNIAGRKITSTLTILGIGLVVFVFIGSQMLSAGLEETLVATGTDGNVIAIRQASQTEVMSIINYDQAQIFSASPEIAKDENSEYLYTNEVYVLINVFGRDGGDEANVVARGITDKSFALRPMIKLAEGRMWQDAGSEIIAGKSAAERFLGCGLGETVRFGARDWTVVGIMDAEGSAFDNEIWGDINQLSDAFRRPIYSSITIRMNDTTQFESLKKRIEDDPRLPLELKREKDYYKAQSRTISAFLSIAGGMISFIFSLGAVIGAMITMYAAVANRTREIGTLRALGFGRLSILTTFLFESILISTAGGIIGLLAASFLRMLRISTTNWDTFSEIAFNFDLSASIALSGLMFAAIMGIIGGFLPAARAAMLKIVDSLRSA